VTNSKNIVLAVDDDHKIETDNIKQQNPRPPERSPRIREEEAQKDKPMDLRYKSIFNLNVEQETQQVDRSKMKPNPSTRRQKITLYFKNYIHTLQLSSSRFHVMKLLNNQLIINVIEYISHNISHETI
jgi:hypothetical protein